MRGTGEFAKANYMVGFHTSVIQTSTSRTSNNARKGKCFTFLPSESPLHLCSICVNQVMQSKCKR